MFAGSRTAALLEEEKKNHVLLWIQFISHLHCVNLGTYTHLGNIRCLRSKQDRAKDHPPSLYINWVWVLQKYHSLQKYNVLICKNTRPPARQIQKKAHTHKDMISVSYQIIADKKNPGATAVSEDRRQKKERKKKRPQRKNKKRKKIKLYCALHRGFRPPPICYPPTHTLPPLYMIYLQPARRILPAVDQIRSANRLWRQSSRPRRERMRLPFS